MKTLLTLLFCFPFLLFAQNEIPQWAKLLYSENPNATEVREAYESYYQTHEFVKTIHTQNYKRWIAKIRPFVYENGNVQVPDVQTKIETQNNAAAYRSGGGDNIWTYAGPEIHYSSDGTLTPISEQANVYCHDRSLANPNLLFCGTESGGLYKSLDQGQNWTFVTKEYVINSVSAVRIHPTDDNTIIFSAENDLYRSTDGGTNWEIIGDPAFQSLNISASEIAFNPENPDIVYAACNEGFFRSLDGGDNWTEVLFNESQVVQFKPDDPSVVYTLQKITGSTEYKFYKSTNYGQSFTLFDAGWFEMLSGYEDINVYGGRIAVSEADPNRIYALLVGYGQYDADSYTNGWIGTWVSYDAGATWSFPHDQIGTPYSSEHPNLMNFSADDGDYTQILYNTTMVASQLNADYVLIGGLNLWQSSDACQTYQGLGGYIGGLPYFHVDQQELRIYKTGENSEEVWCSNDGGICYSTDFMQTISNRCNGIQAVNLWGYDQGWNEDIMVGGRYHNGNFGYFENYDQGDALALGGGEAPTGYVNYSDENKTYFSDIAGRILPDEIDGEVQYFSMTMAPTESYWFNSSSRIMFDNEYYNVAWLGKENKLYRSNNGGGSFGEWYSFGVNANNPVLWMTQSYSDPNIMYLNQRTGNSSKIMKSSDHGNTWEQINIPSSSANLFFDIGATNPYEIWVAYPYGSNGNKIYHTIDGGENWTNMTSSILDNTQIWGVAHQFGTDGGVYIALLNGAVLYRNNTMAEWALYSDGLPISTQPLRIVPQYKKGLIRLATWNLGVWEAPLYEPSSLIADFASEFGTFFCPGDPIHFVDHSVSGDNATYEWSFPGGNPSASTEKNPTITYETSGSFDVSLTVTENGISNTITKTQYIESEESVAGVIAEDFEQANFPENWVFAHSTGGSSNWAVGNAASAYDIGSYSMYFDNYNNDVQGNRDEVWAGKQLYITSEDNYELTFDVAYAEYGGQYSDTLGVLLSVDCGETWTEMYVKGGDDLATAPDNDGPFVPSESEWRNEVIDLEEYFSELSFQGGEFIVAFQNRGRWGNIIYVDNINIDNTVDVNEEVSNAQLVKVFPNPSSNKVTILASIFTNQMVDVQITNQMGQIVFSDKQPVNGGILEKTIDISRLSNGIFFLRLSSNQNNQVIKIEKISQ
jgi:photosystem II stability/assembly factor-like uncharacterized protein/PKD repeat protein